MPTVFDSNRPHLSHQLTSMQSARDKMNGYIAESSFDLKDAARFTFDRGSKASKKIFASIPKQILRQKLDEQTTYSLERSQQMVDRTTQYLEQQGDVHNRGATGTGFQQDSPRRRIVYNQMDNAAVAQLTHAGQHGQHGHHGQHGQHSSD